MIGGEVELGAVLAQTALQEVLDNYVPAEFTGAVASLLKFVVAFVAIYLLGKTFVSPLARRVMEQRGLERHARMPIQKLVTILIVFVAISVAFGFAGFGSFLTSLATIAAAATLAIGFAMQNVISNFVSGVFIFTEQPFKLGDWVEFDGNGGIVEDISLRVTRVRTFDNELLTVPNSQLTDNVVKNPVALGKLRLQFLFGISYDDDIDPAANIIVEEAENHPEIMDDPAPTVRLTELGDSYVGLKSRIWIDDPSRSDYVRIRGEYIQAVKEGFDDAEIDIPFPNRTLGGTVELADSEQILADD
jgi:small-conductance mechanosensitive channel